MLTQEVPEKFDLIEYPEQMGSVRCPVMIGLKEAAARTGLSYDWLRKQCLAKKIVHIRAGKKIFVNMGFLIEYLSRAGLAESEKEKSGD